MKKQKIAFTGVMAVVLASAGVSASNAAAPTIVTKGYVHENFAPKGDLTELQGQVSDNAEALLNAATKDEVQAVSDAVELKANADDVYTKDEVDDKVSQVVVGDMADALSQYAKTENVNAQLELKADASDVETLQSNYTNLDSTVSGHAGRITQLESDYGTLDSTVSSHTSTLNNLDTTIANKITAALANSGDAYVTKSEIPAQVQSDWNETDADSAAYIVNKPNMAEYATALSVNALSATVGDNTTAIQSNADAIAENANAITGLNDSIDNKANLQGAGATQYSSADAQIAVIDADGQYRLSGTKPSDFIPTPGDECTADSTICVLSVNKTTKAYEWVAVANE